MVESQDKSFKRRLDDAATFSQDDAYLTLSTLDRLRLKVLRERIDLSHPAFLDAFYEQLLSLPHIRSCRYDHGLIDRLRKSQQTFFDGVTKGEPLEQCAVKRRRICIVYDSLGLKSTWVLSAYISLIGDVLRKMINEYRDNYAEVLETALGLFKTVLLDITITFDSNILADRSDSNILMRAILQNTADVLVAINEEGTILFCNSTIEEMFGYTVQEIHGQNISILMGALHAAKHDQHIKYYLNSGRSKVIGSGMREVQGKHKDGTEFALDVSISEVLIGNERTFIGALRDCSDRKVEQTQMRKLSRALEQSADSVVITDTKGVIEYVNPAFENVTGFSKLEAIGNKPNIIKSGLQDEAFYKNLWEIILQGNVFREVIINRKKDGTIYYEEKTITPLVDAQTDEITHFISTGKDITERMRAQQRLHLLAYYDPLTELPNRTLFMERLNTAITRATRHKRQLAVLLLNLDRFKIINDTLGYEVGDALLVELAKRLTGLLRQEDTVAHMGGNNFAIMLEEVVNVEDVPDMVQKILHLFGRSFELQGHELFATVSIGVSVFPQDGLDSSRLMRNAEVAMYRVKSGGRNNYHFYTADMNAMALKRFKMETKLRRAVEREEFLLYYQPQVHLATGKIVGMEALARWQHPELGLIQPNDFIPLLEETGLILTASHWVLEQACHQNQEWRKAGLAELTTSVNLSALQFRQRSLASDIDSILTKSGLPPAALQLEVTESCIMQSEKSVMRTLQTLHQMGVQLAIDDFGTGYSSLSYLKNMPVDILKLDKSFVDGLPGDISDAGITRAVIAMAHNLRMQVVAEGVENEQQLSFLYEEGCDLIQGFLFSRPVPASAVSELLISGKTL